METGMDSFQSFWHTLDCIFSWLEDHSGIIGIITAIIAGSLWFRKYLMQKRIEAFFGFYARLLLQLKGLKSLLDAYGLLQNRRPRYGNIYILLYSGDIPIIKFNAFPMPSENLLEDLKRLASQLKNTLIESENNVYPKISEKVRWYDSQHTLFEFCEFLEFESMRGITNILKKGGEYKHVIKCRNLINAMNYIEESIEKEISDNKY